MAIENDMICNRSTQFVAYSYIFLFLFFILCSFLSLMADMKNSISQIGLFSQNSLTNIGGNRRFMSLAPISLAPHLIDPLPIGPTHWSPTKLFDLKGPNFLWFPNLLPIHHTGQFWPSINVVSVCLYILCSCINPLLVRVSTCDPFRPGSPNLDQRSKTTWLRSLLFVGWLTLTFKVKVNLKVKIYPIFSLSAT